MPKAQRINFDDLKAKADFRLVLAHYGLTIVGQGDQAKVLCPFHDDARPSCSVNLQKGLWHCFAWDLVRNPGRGRPSPRSRGYAGARCRMRSGSHGTAAASGILRRAPR